jgi:hypothetical protein
MQKVEKRRSFLATLQKRMSGTRASKLTELFEGNPPTGSCEKKGRFISRRCLGEIAWWVGMWAITRTGKPFKFEFFFRKLNRSDNLDLPSGLPVKLEHISTEDGAARFHPAKWALIKIDSIFAYI